MSFITGECGADKKTNNFNLRKTDTEGSVSMKNENKPASETFSEKTKFAGKMVVANYAI